MIYTNNNSVYCGQFHQSPSSSIHDFFFMGPTGVTGPSNTGMSGSTGFTGPTGFTGMIGDTFPYINTGLTGPIGYTGNVGYYGYDGPMGMESITGTTGMTGVNLNPTIYTLGSSISLNESFIIDNPSNYKFADIKICSGGGQVTTQINTNIGGGGSGNVLTLQNIFLSSSLYFTGLISSQSNYGNTVELSMTYNNITIPICSITGGQNENNTATPTNGVITQTYTNCICISGNLIDADFVTFAGTYNKTLYGGYPIDCSNVITLSRGGSIQVDGDQNLFLNYQGGNGGIIITYYN